MLFQELIAVIKQLEVADASCKLVAVCYIMEWYHRRLWGLGCILLSFVPRMGHHVWYSYPICSVLTNVAHNAVYWNDAGETFTPQLSCLLSLVCICSCLIFREKTFFDVNYEIFKLHINYFWVPQLIPTVLHSRMLKKGLSTELPVLNVAMGYRATELSCVYH